MVRGSTMNIMKGRRRKGGAQREGKKRGKDKQRKYEKNKVKYVR